MGVSVVCDSWLVDEEVGKLEPTPVAEDVGKEGFELAVFGFHFLLEELLFADRNGS
jgi:hypothetical protein